MLTDYYIESRGNKDIKPAFNSGFTLAEALLAMALVGIIAAMTIPALLKNFTNLSLYSSYNAANKIMASASRMVYQENGENLSGVFSNVNELMYAYNENLRVSRVCEAGSSFNDCWHSDGAVKDFNGNISPLPNGAGLVLSNGMLVLFSSTEFNPNCNSNYVEKNGENVFCDEFFIDTNGFSGPNKQGRDVFRVFLTKDKMLLPGQSGYDYPAFFALNDFELWCGRMVSPGWDGSGCALRLAMERSMNY